MNSGSPTTTLLETIYLQQINDFQRNEEVAKEARDSDSPIVVRDGNAGHKAKEWAGRHRKHSTYTGTCRSRLSVSSSLLASGVDSGTECLSWFQLRVFLRSPVR